MEYKGTRMPKAVMRGVAAGAREAQGMSEVSQSLSNCMATARLTVRL